mgnify:CR=1 FL=1
MLVPLRRSPLSQDQPFNLRQAGEADLGDILRIYTPYVLQTAISFEEQVPNLAEMRDRMGALIPSYPYLVADRAGEVLGYAYAGPHRSRSAYRYSVDVTVYVDPSAHRQGIGLVLYDQLFADLADFGFKRAFAAIALPNVASVGLHKALGFELVGVYHKVGYKFDRWHDVSWWQRDVRSGHIED